MISFFNPGLLWALPLAAAPVVIHLFFLRRARILKFGDLTLLRRAYLKSLPASRLRQWLLLAVRCGLLALLVLAFAHPVYQPGAAGAAANDPEGGARLVALLDASYSMDYHVQGKTRLEAARAAGEAVLRLLRPQDKVAATVFSDRIEAPSPPAALEWTDASRAAETLRRAEPTPRGTDYGVALRAAYDLLQRTRGQRKAILMLSDNAAHGWRSADPGRLQERIPSYDPSVLLLGVGWKDSPENAAIASVRPEGDGSNPIRLSVQTLMRGTSRRRWSMDLWREGRRAASRGVDLSPSQETPVEFPLPSQEGSGASAWGRVQLREDALPGDDAYYYAFWMENRPRVLLVYGGPHALEVGRGVYFFKKLFAEAQGSLLPYRLDIVDSVRFKSLSLKDYRAVVLMDFREISDEIADSLDGYVRDGGGLWLMTAPDAKPESYRRLARTLPAKIEDASETLGPEAGLKPDAGLDELGPLRFSWKDFELQKVEVRKSHALIPADRATVWFRDGRGRPLMASGGRGRGRVLVWASPLDVEWTNLCVKPVFAAWVDAALGHLTRYSNRLQWRTVAIGEPIARTWGLDEPAPASVLLRNPQGRSITLRVVQRKAQFMPETPGIYFMDATRTQTDNGGGDGNSQSEAFAVNLDRSTGESDLTAGRNPWKSLNPQALGEDFVNALYGRQARTAAISLALVLMALEMLLANR